MKRIVLAVLIGLGAWDYFDKQSASTLEEVSASVEKSDLSYADASVSTSQPFNCDGRTHCSEMTSRAEAEFFNKNCPGTKMDGDHDGEPCENDSRF